MPDLIIVNPTRRKSGKKKTPAKGRRNMASKRTRKKIARRKPSKRRPTKKPGMRLAPRRRGRRLVSSGKRRRARRNPSGGANVKLPVVGNVNLVDVAGGTAGSVVAKMIPNLLAGKLGLPVTGAMKYPIQLASGLAVSYVAANFLKMKGVGRMTALFVINNILTDLANEFLVTPAGMGAYMGNWPPNVYLPIEQYRETESLMGRYDVATDNKGVFSPMEGVYEVGDVPDRFKPRF